MLRALDLPSGARVGLANEVRERLRIEWVDPRDPTKGFRHLYLDPADYEALQVIWLRQHLLKRILR